MSVKNCEMGLSLIECRTGRVTLSPKPSSHAGLFGRFGNGKNKAVWARLRWRLIRWRGVFLMPSTRLEIVKKRHFQKWEFRAHGRALARMLAA